ncbi:hypothetical protein [Larkinella soli]|uniref:hypothetical protein n=1 Tax=Larkinella soli TaxID=1770527 RepID=UPI000FFB730A|nr:hypothetical protein [Larkinella soli]
MKKPLSTEELRRDIDQGRQKSHADDTDPDEKRNVPEDGPSGENTENGGERGGGLWTSGGFVTSGESYHGYDGESDGEKQEDKD